MPIKLCSQARYQDMLSVLPPALWLNFGFLVGEAHDHGRCKVTGYINPTFASFFNHNGCYYEGEPMTMSEFKAFDVDTLP